MTSAFAIAILHANLLWAQVDLPHNYPNRAIQISAASGHRWTQGAYEVWILRGGCRVAQGADTAQAREGVVWIYRAGPTETEANHVIAYLDGDAVLQMSGQTTRGKLTDRTWLGRLETTGSIDVLVSQSAGPPDQLPPVYERAAAARKQRFDAAIQQVHYVEPGASVALADATTPASNTIRLRVYRRSDTPVQARWENDLATQQWVGVVDGGVNLLVEGLTLPGKKGISRALGSTGLGTLDISTDRLVIWTTLHEEPSLKGDKAMSADTPLEIYMEGNIVFRQGERTIYADRMYYDVKRQIGTVLNAELFAPVSKYQGLLRLKTAVLQQTGAGQFVARDAYVTSSRLGEPTYRMQAGRMEFTDEEEETTDPITGAPIRDAETGELKTRRRQRIVSDNNVLYMEGMPIFYWPRMATDLDESALLLHRLKFRNDSVFGTQVFTDWNLYHLLGCRDKPEGTKWDLSLDYLSKRGFGHGSTFTYNRDELLGMSGKTAGLVDYWGIFDNGNDNLGRDQRIVPPAVDYRYRFITRHRQMLDNDIQVSLEVGAISDRNFLNSYFEREWDELKDMDTALELKKIRDNTSWSLVASGRLNDFFTQTEWLPRGDHFWLGQPLANNTLSWFEHSSVGYAQFRTGEPPAAAQNPGDKFRFLPWEVSPTDALLNTQSGRFITRQELDWPFQAGWLKIVPFVLGEAAYWGEDTTGNDVSRVYGQAGIRASIPAWATFPDFESVFWNVHGLAHKVVFDFEYAYTDSNKNVDRLPLYDPLDDDSIEAFRRRFVPNTFSALPGSLAPSPAIPLRFDERFYAVRTGMAGWVTAPSYEVVEDLQTFRVGMRNRWQTHRGTPGNERIVDWITFDTNVTFFPDPKRDNFGQPVGLVDYDARWQVGDRLALLSSGLFDFFDQGQKVITVGGFLERPPKGGLYVGVHFLDGPVHNTILAMSYSYRMSEKWVTAFGSTVDLSGQGNIGQHFSLTRVGESFLVSGGFNVDASRGDWGVALSVEPRFLPKGKLGQAGGARILPAGATGLE